MLGAGAGADDGPSLLALTRQNLPQVRTKASNENLSRARRLPAAAPPSAARKVVLIATGSEVEIALDVADALEAQGIGADVVSMPCSELFDAQDAGLSRRHPARRTRCASRSRPGTTLGWERYTGRDGLRIGIDRFGASAPADGPVQAFRLHRRGDRAADRRRHCNSQETMTWRPKLRSTVSGASAASSPARSSSAPISGLELVAINDLADAKSNALLFKRDSVHGAFPGEVSADGNDLIINGKRIKVTAERDPAKLPHGDNGVDIALECTGFFADRERRAEASRRRRQASPDLGPGQGRRPDRRLRRQPRQADRRAHDRLQRLLHHQLPRAGRQGDERRDRHRARADDHDPRLHQRPEDPRPDPHRHAPRPRRRRCR